MQRAALKKNERGQNQVGQKGKWVTQYELCSVNGFESSKPGRTGRDKGCHVDLGIFRTVLPLFQTSVSALHKGEVCQRSGLPP